MKKMLLAFVLAVFALSLVAQLPKPGSGSGGSGGGTAGTDYAATPIYDTYANIVAVTCNAANNGRRAQASDYPQLTAECRSSAWAWNWNGLPVTLPSCTGGTEVNFNAATSVTTSPIIRLTETGGDTAANNFKLYVCEKPSVPYTITMDVITDLWPINFSNAGVVLYETGTNKILHAYSFSSTGSEMFVVQYGTTTAQTSQPYTLTSNTHNMSQYWASSHKQIVLAEDATNVTVSIRNKVTGHAQQLYQVAKTTPFTTAPSHYGVVVHTRNATYRTSAIWVGATIE